MIYSARSGWALLFCECPCANLCAIRGSEAGWLRFRLRFMRRCAKKIRGLSMCAAVIFALLGTCLPSAHGQDAGAAAAEKPTHAESKPATSKIAAAPHSGAAAKSHYRKPRRSTSKRKTARGQQKIDSERAQEIQQALIREHYLSPKDEGTWNQASEDAMRRYQADHGWQSKTVPDSRALISLGLGPSHDHLLNPESAMTSDPAPAHQTASAAKATHAAASGPSAPSSMPTVRSQPDPPAASAPGASDPSHPQ
jgi:hypothetical protein